MRATLEAAAESAGRSLSEEIQFRLEQSFEKDDAAGGSELRGLFSLMKGAADIINARANRPFSEDPETFMVVKSAWHRLIRTLSPSPDSNLQYLASIGVPTTGLSRALGPRPCHPSYPEGIGFGLLTRTRSPEQEADYIAAMEKYLREDEEYTVKLEERMSRAREAEQRINELMDVGRNIALDLLPPASKMKSRGGKAA